MTKKTKSILIWSAAIGAVGLAMWATYKGKKAIEELDDMEIYDPAYDPFKFSWSNKSK